MAPQGIEPRVSPILEGCLATRPQDHCWGWREESSTQPQHRLYIVIGPRVGSYSVKDSFILSYRNVFPPLLYLTCEFWRQIRGGQFAVLPEPDNILFRHARFPMDSPSTMHTGAILPSGPEVLGIIFSGIKYGTLVPMDYIRWHPCRPDIQVGAVCGYWR